MWLCLHRMPKAVTKPSLVIVLAHEPNKKDPDGSFLLPIIAPYGFLVVGVVVLGVVVVGAGVVAAGVLFVPVDAGALQF